MSQVPAGVGPNLYTGPTVKGPGDTLIEQGKIGQGWNLFQGQVQPGVGDNFLSWLSNTTSYIKSPIFWIAIIAVVVLIIIAILKR